ncbi:MAG: bacteriophage Gp15 family protein [Clostridiaceae bacterium]|nr:bacteriophage Gp15 family protein [Clostridiaceae bacterium]MBW4860335.1 bacteriophage Gp15 family protein [Clostridiaceae bacterium]MBW4867218.1 bacteriophage Gp15 family protein [Clostridiaceae bacterium]
MRLNDPLITSFIYDGKEYTIDLAFDNVLDVFDVLNDDTLRNNEKAEIALELLLDEHIEEDIIGIWNYIYKEFIEVKSKQYIEYDLKGNPMPIQDEENDSFIDLDKDAEYIYASFMQAYNIDLYEQQGKLHWYEFKALLNGLPSNTIMQRIIQIRMWKPSKHESSEYKENMRKLQKVYALDEKEELE